MQLINEKFTYSVDPTHVSRERLVNLLSGNLKTTSATIISARAGTGKTALAAEFATRSGRNVAWFKVESSDAEWVNPFFSRLLPLLPGDVHLLITCRSLLPAPLWRMRSKQQLCLVDEDNLNFTFEEARQLCDGYGLSDFVASIALEESRGKA